MYLSDEVGMLLTIIFVVVCILNIILFFKVWRMTNTVENIFKLSLTKSGLIMKEEQGDGALTKNTIFVKEEL
tara:strand:+ start:366 stop:581 length:216 start_codon:yes stop_codon:yes gene_type:complete